MPKKSASARSGAQRNRPKTQRNVELVRPVTETQEEGAAEQSVEPTPVSLSTATATSVESTAPQENTESTAPKGSAAARLAARRQAAQKAQQRNAAALITAEHFSYVRRDLITIAILAGVLFAAIIVLYFTLGSTL